MRLPANVIKGDGSVERYRALLARLNDFHGDAQEKWFEIRLAKKLFPRNSTEVKSVRHFIRDLNTGDIEDLIVNVNANYYASKPMPNFHCALCHEWAGDGGLTFTNYADAMQIYLHTYPIVVIN